MSESILLVDDDALLRRSLAYSLERAGYRVATAADAADGLAQAERDRPDLVLLDIGLPGMDGLEALRHFQERFHLPVILLTARRRGQDEALGLELGADDYVSKPYDLDALLARMRSALRRAQRPGQTLPESVIVGDLVVDPQARTVAVGENELDLPPRVFDLLYLLASQAGRVIPLDTLLTEVWGPQFEGESQVVYVHIRWLRDRLQSIPNHPVRIVTVHRVGYKLVLQED